jgi:hypothetical protein
MVGISKLSFGAYDVAPGNFVASPSTEISQTPIQDKHGYMESDLYGTKKAIGHKNNESDYYMSSNPYASANETHKKHSILKPLLVLGAVTIGGVVAYKKRKNIADFFKGIFKKKSGTTTNPTTTTPTTTQATKTKRSPAFVSLDKFNDYVSEVNQKFDAHDFENIKPEEMKVIFEKGSVGEKKQALLDLYELAKTYTHKDVQPTITILMPEALQKDADHIVDMFSKNRIDEVKNKLINRIEGFKITTAEKSTAETTDMIVDKQVRHGVNAESTADVANKVGRNVRDFFKNLF